MELVRLFEAEGVVQMELPVNGSDSSGSIDPQRGVINSIGQGAGFVNRRDDTDTARGSSLAERGDERAIDGFCYLAQFFGALTRRRKRHQEFRKSDYFCRFVFCFLDQA